MGSIPTAPTMNDTADAMNPPMMRKLHIPKSIPFGWTEKDYNSYVEVDSQYQIIRGSALKIDGRWIQFFTRRTYFLNEI